MDAIQTVDELGKIIIPKTVRERMSIDAGDQFEMVTQGTKIILVRHMPKCSECGYDDNVQMLGEAYYCEECRENLGQVS